MVLVVKGIIVIFRKIKTILIFISFKHYFSHPEKKSILKSSLTLRRHCYSGPRSLIGRKTNYALDTINDTYGYILTNVQALIIDPEQTSIGLV